MATTAAEIPATAPATDRPSVTPRRGWRSRWAAIGAAVAVTLGAGATTWQATASSGGDESTFVPVTPTRILDTRIDLGLTGPFTSADPRTLTVTGQIPTADGTQTVVPTHANGIALNVTAVAPAAAGFISVRPGDATGTPTTSSLNFEAGDTTPNAVTVSVPTSGTGTGQIELTYDAYGQIGPTTDILVDVVGYTTTAGLDAIVADLAQKADIDDVIAHGPITMHHGNALLPRLTIGAASPFPDINEYRRSGASSVMPHNGGLLMNLAGPDTKGGISYRLDAVSYCITQLIGDVNLDEVEISSALRSDVDGFVDDTTRDEFGCHTLDVDVSGDTSFVAMFLAGGSSGGEIGISDVRSTWVPVDG